MIQIYLYFLVLTIETKPSLHYMGTLHMWFYEIPQSFGNGWHSYRHCLNLMDKRVEIYVTVFHICVLIT